MIDFNWVITKPLINYIIFLKQILALLETILRMINYLAWFAPHLSEVNALLQQLLKQDSEFLWDKNHGKDW